MPYSPEYRERQTNLALLESLAQLKPAGGDPGRIISGPLTDGKLDRLLTTNTFRRDLAKAVSSQYVWPLLLLMAGCVFFADVFVRRVALSWQWAAPLWCRLVGRPLRRQSRVEPDQRLERLRSRKAEIGQQIDQRRAAAGFEGTLSETEHPASAAGSTEAHKWQAAKQPGSTEKTAPGGEATDKSAEDEYTARLLEAKKQVWKQDRRGPQP